MIVVDTSVVVAFMNSGDSAHAEVSAWIEHDDEGLATTPLALAEIDHLVARAGGAAAAESLRDDLRRGAYTILWWPQALRDTVVAATRHASLSVGLTDASLVAAAAHLETVKIATLDHRHFRSLPPLTGEPAFVLLPADA